jgi:hypothetical protein
MRKPNREKADNKAKSEIAYDLFINTDKSQKEICALIGWTERTFTKYKRDGLWEEQKSALKLTPGKIILNIYKRMHEISETGNPDADKLIKLANTLEKLLDKKTTISQAMSVFKEFTTFLWDQDPEFAKQNNIYQQQFVDLKIASYG